MREWFRLVFRFLVNSGGSAIPTDPPVWLAFTGQAEGIPTMAANEKTVTIGDGPFVMTITPKHHGHTVKVNTTDESVQFDDSSLFTASVLPDQGDGSVRVQFQDQGKEGVTGGSVQIDVTTAPGHAPEFRPVAFTLTAQNATADEFDVSIGDQTPSV